MLDYQHFLLFSGFLFYFFRNIVLLVSLQLDIGKSFGFFKHISRNIFVVVCFHIFTSFISLSLSIGLILACIGRKELNNEDTSLIVFN